MYGARYAWLIPGWFSKNWWKINLDNETVGCTEKEMDDAVKGYIACDNLKISPDDTVTASGQVTKFVAVNLTETDEQLDHSSNRRFTL